MCLAVPGKIESIEDQGDFSRVGTVEFDGIRRDVNLAYLPEAEVGQYVIVHVGFAISVVDEEEAKKTLEAFRELGALEEEFGEGNEVPG